MGSESSKVAINEIVFFLSRTDLSALKGLRERYPQLAGELKEGIYAGPENDKDRSDISHLIGKADLSIQALSRVLVVSQNAKIQIAKKVRRAKKTRLLSQFLVLFGSSSVLGAVAFNANYWTFISGVVTFVAGLLGVFTDYQEMLLNPQNGNLYQAFQTLGEGIYKSEYLKEKLKHAMSHTDGKDDLKDLIGEANSLFNGLNNVLIQLDVHFPSQ